MPLTLRAFDSCEMYGYVQVALVFPGFGLSLRKSDTPIISKYEENVDFEATVSVGVPPLGLPPALRASSALLFHRESMIDVYWYMGVGAGINQLFTGNAGNWDTEWCPFIPLFIGRQKSGFADFGCDITLWDGKICPLPTVRWAWMF